MKIGTEFHNNKTIIIQSWIFLEDDKKYLMNLWMNFDKTGHSVWFGGTYVRTSPIFRLPTPDAYNIVPDQKKKREGTYILEWSRLWQITIVSKHNEGIKN